MPARALIVLLLILNLGVALWWATRGEPVSGSQAPALPAGAERLRLLDEPPASAPPAAVATAAVARASDEAAAPGSVGEAGPPEPDPLLRTAPPDPAPAAGPQRCHRFGPFADAAAAQRAVAVLQPMVQGLAVRETRPAARGWDVRMSALPDRAAAEAMATRLVAAGFADHYLLPAADDGSVDIALGRFGSEESARRHRAALQAAGFDAVASPIGDGQARHWIHAALAAGADPAALQRAAGAAQAAAVDCASLDAPGG